MSSELTRVTAQTVFTEMFPGYGNGGLQTTDSTTTILNTITPPEFSTGVLWVMYSGSLGVDSTTIAGITGIKQVRYKKSDNIVTLGTVENIMATETDTELAGALVDIVASGGDIVIEATGLAATLIDWEENHILNRSITTYTAP